MIESKLIPTETISFGTVTAITIWTFYNQIPFVCGDDSGFSDFPNTLRIFISTAVGFENGIGYQSGELIISLKNYPDNFFYIDNQGHLIVVGDDANSYSIDENGHLIYDVCEEICGDDHYVNCDYVEQDYVQ